MAACASPAGGPQVVAHRGSSASTPSTRSGAYLQALDEGADALECDVRLTADGHLVCVHDRRVDRTTNARGVVSTMTLAELDELDAASWKNPWADLDDEAPRCPTATQTGCSPCAGCSRRCATTTGPSRWRSRPSTPPATPAWSSAGWWSCSTSSAGPAPDSPARVMSFSGVALTRVQRLAPELEVVLLIEGKVSWQVTRAILRPGWIAGPGIDELREQARLGRGCCASAATGIHVWTVNTEADLELCLGLGVEAVITDRPDHILQLLGRRLSA